MHGKIEHKRILMLTIRIGQRTADQLIFSNVAKLKCLPMQKNLLSQQVIDRQKRNRLIRRFTYRSIFKSEAYRRAGLKRKKCFWIDFLAKIRSQFFDQRRNPGQRHIRPLYPNLNQFTKNSNIILRIGIAGSEPLVINTTFFQRCQGNNALYPAFYQFFQCICGKSIFILETRVVFTCDIQQHLFPALWKPKVIKGTALTWSKCICQRINFIVHRIYPFCKLDRRGRKVF